jgi:hypothetical protein
LNNFPLVGLRTVATLTGLDRDVIRTSIERASLTPAGKLGGHPAFNLADILHALFARRGEIAPSLLSPIERRALADAHLRELELSRRRGAVLDRADVQQAAATAFATCATAINSIPDRLELAGLAPEFAERAEREIHSALSHLADQLEEMHKNAKA